MASSAFGFSKKEKLTGRKNIEELFQKGSSFRFKSFLIKYATGPKTEGVDRVLISVPKKKFKRAVDRNLIKRRIREAYRLNKNLLLSPEREFTIAFIYLSPTILTFAEIQPQLIEVLKRLKDLKEINYAEEK